MAKQWFVILQESEIMSFKNPFERLIYESIKSFCGNGKTEAALSTREIATRASVSHATVKDYLPVLLQRGFIKITGEKKRVGGSVPIYKVYAPLTVSVSPSDTLLKKSVSPRTESVSPRTESVSGVGTKSYKVKRKKVNKTEDVLNKFSAPYVGNAKNNSEVGEMSAEHRAAMWRFANKMSDRKIAMEAAGKK